MTNTFNLHRLYRFMYRLLAMKQHSLLINLLASMGPLLAIFFLIAHFNPENALNGMQYGFSFPLVIIGLIASSKIFASVHNPHLNYNFFTLPVSTTEKFIGSWLLSGPLFALGFLLVYGLGYFLLCLAYNHLELFTAFFTLPKTYESISNFLFWQPVFLFGAIYFKNNQFMKTIGSIFLFYFICLILFITLGLNFGKEIFGSYMNSMTMNGQITEQSIELNTEIQRIIFISRLVVMSIGAIFLTLTYFKLRNKQA